MKAKPKGPEQDDLFRARLVEIIDMRHEYPSSLVAARDARVL